MKHSTRLTTDLITTFLQIWKGACTSRLSTLVGGRTRKSTRKLAAKGCVLTVIQK